MIRLLKLFMWTQGLLGGLLAVGLGLAVLALPTSMSIWEDLARHERDENAAAAPTRALWGFTKSPLPAFQDFPPASQCVTLPSTVERRATGARLHTLSLEQVNTGVSVAHTRLLQRRNFEDLWVIEACRAASREILGRYPSNHERISIASPGAWDARQHSRFPRAVWTWRFTWVCVPLAAICVGMGIAVVCLRGLLDVFRESNHSRKQ